MDFSKLKLIGLATFFGFILGLFLCMLTGIATVGAPVWLFFIILVSLFFISWIGFSYGLYRVNDLRRMFGWASVALAIEFFLMPIVAIIYTINYTAANVNVSDAAEVIGAGVGGGVITIIAGVIGFFLGIVFVIIGHFALRAKDKTKKKE